MLRILGASLTVALACVTFVVAQPSGNKSVVNGVTMEGDSITADLPESEHIKNIGSRLDGAGMCVFSSIEMAARYQGLEEMRGWRDWCAAKYRGGEYASETVALRVGDVITIVVGDGGAGGTAGNSGVDGTQSSVASRAGSSFTTVSANGGSGGAPAGAGTGGQGGTGSTNTTHTDGGNGATGNGTTGGTGGASGLQSGAAGGTGSNTGSAGTSGAGGGGGGPTNGVGGAGGNGVVIIEKV